MMKATAYLRRCMYAHMNPYIYTMFFGSNLLHYKGLPPTYKYVCIHKWIYIYIYVIVMFVLPERLSLRDAGAGAIAGSTFLYYICMFPLCMCTYYIAYAYAWLHLRITFVWLSMYG